jgi:hypothetical protein
MNMHPYIQKNQNYKNQKIQINIDVDQRCHKKSFMLYKKKKL